jgi:hypothetical protein
VDHNPSEPFTRGDKKQHENVKINGNLSLDQIQTFKIMLLFTFACYFSTTSVHSSIDIITKDTCPTQLPPLSHSYPTATPLHHHQQQQPQEHYQSDPC